MGILNQQKGHEIIALSSLEDHLPLL